jgi:hypothetical protein
MRRLLLLSAAVGALLGAVSSTGALAAGPGPVGNPPSPPGQEQVPPGQAKKADDVPAPAPAQEHVPPGHADESAAPQAAEQPKPDHPKPDHANHGDTPTESSAPKPVAEEKHDKHDKRVASPPEPQSAPRPAKPAAPRGNSSVAHTHVIICHRTGSKSNPYVVINISMSAWLHGHATHPERNGHNDILLKQGAAPGEKMPQSACGGSETVTPIDPTRPKPPGKPEDPRSDPPSKPAASLPSGSTSTPLPGPTGSAPGSSHDPKRSDGPRDTSVAAQVAETESASELPFTGMPLWVAILVGFWLIGTGLAIRNAFDRPAEEVARRRDQFTW